MGIRQSTRPRRSDKYTSRILMDKQLSLHSYGASQRIMLLWANYVRVTVNGSLSSRGGPQVAS